MNYNNFYCIRASAFNEMHSFHNVQTSMIIRILTIYSTILAHFFYYRKEKFYNDQHFISVFFFCSIWKIREMSNRERKITLHKTEFQSGWLWYTKYIHIFFSCQLVSKKARKGIYILRQCTSAKTFYMQRTVKDFNFVVTKGIMWNIPWKYFYCLFQALWFDTYF